MQKTKLVLIITALTLVIAASVAITFAQFANAQTTTPTPNNSYNTQAPYYYNGQYACNNGYCINQPTQTLNGTTTCPNQQNCYPNGAPTQTTNPYPQGQCGMGRGTGMHGRIW